MQLLGTLKQPACTLGEFPQLKVAEPTADYTLRLFFNHGEVRLFDVRAYLDKGVFQELRNPTYFRTVRVDHDAVSWPHEHDFSPATLYLRSCPVEGGAPGDGKRKDPTP